MASISIIKKPLWWFLMKNVVWGNVHQQSHSHMHYHLEKCNYHGEFSLLWNHHHCEVLWVFFMSRFVCIEVDHHTLWNFGGSHYSLSLKIIEKMTMRRNYVWKDLWSNLIKLWKMKGENTLASRWGAWRTYQEQGSNG